MMLAVGAALLAIAPKRNGPKHMAKIVGGIAMSHVPAIGAAIDNGKQSRIGGLCLTGLHSPKMGGGVKARCRHCCVQ